MKQLKIYPYLAEFFSSTKVVNFLIFLFVALVLTCIIAFQNFFFQRIVDNGISKKDIIAPKTITVVDTKRTERHRKEIVQKVEPILTVAEDDFIKNNLLYLQNSIMKIREKDVSQETKLEELSILFDISDNSRKDFVVHYLLKVDETDLRILFDKTRFTLLNLLNSGISEKDVEPESIKKLIDSHMTFDVPRSQKKIITALMEQVLVPNLVVDEIATDIAKRNAQNSVKPYEVVFNKGDKILFEGEPVTKLKRDALRVAGFNIVQFNFSGILGVFLLVIFEMFVFLTYLKTFEKDFIDREHTMILAMLSVIITAISIFMPTGFSPYVLPFPAFIIVASVFTNPRVAFIAASLLLPLVTLGLYSNIEFITAFTLINIVAAVAIANIKFSRRFDLINTGFKISVAGVIIVVGIYLMETFMTDVSNMLILRDASFVFLNGLASGIIALGVLPLFESVFRIITPYGLAELADHNQPLLKRLQFEAPGTYHHSLMVSNLCEAAAEAIGANPILARVGAFYHDIGKLKRPLFFVENQSYFGIENPHTKLNPRLSKMVITAHPKDGVEIAKEYKLPAIIHNFILQHHGEGLASYFYNQALMNEGAENVKEEQFRYTGPKPNSKETAILMIADAVESAVRSLKNPTSEEIEEIINKIIVERLNDGQLADSPLTLGNLTTIASTFSRILRGMQHNRIKYHNDIVSQLDKNKMILLNKIIDTELENKINMLENGENEKTDND